MGVLDEFNKYNEQNPNTSYSSNVSFDDVDKIADRIFNKIGEKPNLLIGKLTEEGPAYINREAFNMTYASDCTEPKRTNTVTQSMGTETLMEIKDAIEVRYSFVKIKNFEDLKEAFERLGCSVSDSTNGFATLKLKSGKYLTLW